MSNTNLRMSTLATEPLYVSFRAENPVTGPIDFSDAGVTADIAVVRKKPTADSWVSATVEGGTWRAADGETYYVATGLVDGPALAPGTFQIYLRVQDGTHTFVQRSGSIEVY